MPSVTIDLITEDQKTGEFALILIEDGLWPSDDADWRECLLRIQTRVFNAIDVAVDGHLAVKYPDSKGKKVRIQIDSHHGPPSRLIELVLKIKEYIADPGKEYRLAIAESQFISGLRVIVWDGRAKQFICET